jgi:hypothetical protein
VGLMGRNGKAEPETYEPGAVRITHLDMSVADVERLGFRVVRHWSTEPAVSERDAYVLSMRKRMIREQHEAKRRRREAEQAAEFSNQVLPGIPPLPGATAVETMLAADSDARPKSVYEELLDEAFAHGRPSIR